MNVNKILLLLIFLFTSLNYIYGQDTVRIDKKPKIILHSWYPEYKKFTKLKIGETKLFFTIITGFEKSSIRNQIHNYDIDLKNSNNEVEIEETPKKNQYIVTVNSIDTKYIEFEVWLEIKNTVILIKQNGKWKNINEIYIQKGNRLLIDTVKLELVK
jgi:hypothetical protein